jgi:hypothetical protein
MLATSGGQGGGRPLAGRGVRRGSALDPLTLFLSGGRGRNKSSKWPWHTGRAVARSGRSGVARGGRPLPEREGSSLPPLSPPPQAANKDVATTLVIQDPFLTSAANL